MVRVDIVINKTTGLDTKYMFPGSATHTASSIEGPSNVGLMTYRHSVPHGSSSTEYTFTVSAPNAIGLNGGTDFMGSTDSYWLGKSNQGTPLASLSSFNDQGQFTKFNVTSFASLTPDALVNALQADG